MATQSGPTTDLISNFDREPDRLEPGKFESKAFQAAPVMGSKGLTFLLVAMCLVPPITIFVLWSYLPPVHEGELKAAVSAKDLPPDEYYVAHYAERPKFSGGKLVVRNFGEQDWTHLNIQVNRHYQIYDDQPIPAGELREFELDRFVSRTGARFNLTYNPLRHVRIYARRPTKDRATFEFSFENMASPDGKD